MGNRRPETGILFDTTGWAGEFGLMKIKLILAIGWSAAVGFMIGTPVHASEKPAPSLIVASDLLKLKQLESPALSPDERSVVYVVRSIEPKPDAKDEWVYQQHLWLAATDGKTPPRQLTRAGMSNSAPAWSPDGRRIAFVRGGAAPADKAQIFVLPLEGGEAFALTKSEFGAGSPRWSPDGTRMLFTSSLSAAQVRAALEKGGGEAKPKWTEERAGRAGGDVGNWALKAAKTKGKPDDEKSSSPTPAVSPDGTLQERREWLAKNEADGSPRALVRLNFLNETDLNPELSFSQLFVQEVREGAEAINLTPGYNGFSGGEWMGDGKSLVAVGARRLDEHPDRVRSFSLYRIDAAGGGATPFLAMPEHSLSDPTPSPDGNWVAFQATPGEASGYTQATVAVVAADGTGAKILTADLDRRAENLRWSPDSAAIFFTAANEGAFPLYRVARTGGAPERLTPDLELGVRAFDIGRDRRVQIVTTPKNPSEMFVGPALGAETGSAGFAALTAHNSSWLTGKKLSLPESNRLMGREGLSVQYWTMKPTEFDGAKKYPLLLQIHGGPAAMWGPGEESMWFEFQYFAARGFAIVYANPRGSTGYGHDFQRANFQNWGDRPAADVLAAAELASKASHVDRKRQVITGGSYGGYLVAWIVAHDHRFKAAVAQRGVYHLPTFFGEGTAWRLVPIAFGGFPWEPVTRSLLERESPFNYVAQIKTPLLIQHGDVDRRTGFVQSEMMLRALKQLGREVESVRYPRANHEMSRSGEPKQRLDSLVRYEEFFRRYIGDN
jgi:dipeptidyl aminopeptidase/acylaminoacyl peptidase